MFCVICWMVSTIVGLIIGSWFSFTFCHLVKSKPHVKIQIVTIDFSISCSFHNMEAFFMCICNWTFNLFITSILVLYLLFSFCCFLCASLKCLGSYHFQLFTTCFGPICITFILLLFVCILEVFRFQDWFPYFPGLCCYVLVWQTTTM